MALFFTGPNSPSRPESLLFRRTQTDPGHRVESCEFTCDTASAAFMPVGENASFAKNLCHHCRITESGRPFNWPS